MNLISELLSSQVNRTEFLPRGDDWTSQLVLVYIFCLVGCDKDLVDDSFVCRDLMLLLRFQFDTFSTYQWTGLQSEDRTRASPEEREFEDETANACCDVSEILARVGANSKLLSVTKTWPDDDVPALSHFNEIDHHHNMIRRIQFLPFSPRGDQVKKNLAFLYLQQVLDCGNAAL